LASSQIHSPVLFLTLQAVKQLGTTKTVTTVFDATARSRDTTVGPHEERHSLDRSCRLLSHGTSGIPRGQASMTKNTPTPHLSGRKVDLLPVHELNTRNRR
jgi:hypothetical protein